MNQISLLAFVKWSQCRTLPCYAVHKAAVPPCHWAAFIERNARSKRVEEVWLSTQLFHVQLSRVTSHQKIYLKRLGDAALNIAEGSQRL